MVKVTCYKVPESSGATPLVADMTNMYHETITRGLSTQGRVHTSKFWRLPTLGDTSIFIGGKQPIRRMHASVMLLWDYSSSQQSFEPALRESLSVIGAALSRLNIDVWAGAYTTLSEGVGIFEVSGWHERWNHRRVSTLKDVDMGDTPTGAALSWVRRYVAPRAPHARRLVLNCTDGAPGDRSVVSDEVRHLRKLGCVVAALYVGDTGEHAIEALSSQYDQRYSFTAATREQIPVAFNGILGRLANETFRR